jgi:hypothetical protein
MKTFKDISALCNLLDVIYKEHPGVPGRIVFATLLEQYVEFTKGQAELFSSTVLTKNSKESAESVKENAWKMQGGWKHLEQQGNPSGYMSTSTETWRFRDNLTYEHKYETYKGYMNPFGSSYSDLSKSEPETGLWAPSDRLEDVFKVVLIASTGSTRELIIEGLDKNNRYDKSCKINHRHFILD